ncbi:MAG: hypothetical protein JO316_03740 [Abitibacteriaceae bacterium]|nr:hypothetical protein [Abditibacteriaceae bacterium]
MQRISGLVWLLFAFSIALATSPPARAIDYTFVGAAYLENPPGDNTDWNDPANWFPGGVPGAGDTVTIGTSSSFPTVTVPPSVTVAGLTFNGGTLQGSTLQGGSLTVTGAGTIAGGDIRCTLNVAVGATMSLTAGQSFNFNAPGAINNAGTFNMNGGGIYSLSSSAAVAFNNSGTLVFGGGDFISASGGGGASGEVVVNNTGTLLKTGTSQSSLSLSTQLNNNGLVDTEAGVLLVQGGNTSVSTGTFNAASGALIQLQNSNTFNNAHFTGAGRTEMIGGSFGPTNGSIIAGDSLGGPGNFVLAGSPIPQTLTTTTTGAGQVLLFSSTITGTLNIPQGSRLDLTDGGSILLDTPGVINNRGTFNMNGASLFRFNGAAPSVFNNFGTLTFSGGDKFGDQTIIVNNTGTIRKLAGAAQSAMSFVTLNNNGLVDVLGGVLIMQGDTDSISSGTFNAAANAIIRLQNRNTFRNAQFIGAGSTELIGLGIDGTVQVGTVPLNLPPSGTTPPRNGDFHIAGATVIGPLTITTSSNGTASATGASTIKAAVNIPAGTTFTVGGTDSSVGGISLGDNGTINNNGTLNFGGGSSTVGSPTAINNSGVMNLLHGASLFNVPGSGSVTTLRNSGVINLDPSEPGSYNFDVNFVQTSSGRFNMQVRGSNLQGTDFDFFSVNSVALAGTLNVDLINHFVPQAGQEFDILRYTSGSHSGQFTTLNGPFHAIYKSNVLTLTPNLDAPRITGFTPGSGQVGTNVIISGANLTGAAVFFNGVRATVNTAQSTATRLVVSVPTGASTGPIRVTTANGSDLSSLNFTVVLAISGNITSGTAPIPGVSGPVANVPVFLANTTNPAALAAVLVNPTLLAGANTFLKHTTTNPQGQFSFTVQPGNYLVVPAQPGVFFTPPFRQLTITTTSSPPQNFAGAGLDNTAPTVTISSATSSSVSGSAGDSTSGVLTIVATLQNSAGQFLNWTATGTTPQFTSAAVIGSFKLATVPGGTAPILNLTKVAAQNWSLLLPAVLPTGSYRLTVRAIDRAFRVSVPVVRVVTKSSSVTTRAASTVTLSSASASAATDSVTLRFSAGLDAEVASDAAHYTVEVNDVPVTVESVSYNAATRVVVLSLPAGALKPGNVVKVSLVDLPDAHGALLSKTQILIAR